jgi:F-type H+-transporting ATPase subunit delta
MRADTVARRYGRALFGLAKSQQALDAVGTSFATIADALADPNVMRILTSPVARERKRAFLTKIVETANAPVTVRDFMLLLADHQRISHAPVIRDVFQSLLDAERGITRATIRSASPLSTEILGEITRTFSTLTGKQVVARVEIVPDLIAGVIVEVEGRVYDGSLRTELDKLQHEMATGS